MNPTNTNQQHHKQARDIVVIGGSAGALEALIHLVSGLPRDFPAAILVVLHIPAHVPSELHRILERLSHLPAARAVDGEPILPGRIYVASADRHLMVEGEHIRLTRGPRESRSRPSVDVLFRSTAYHYGPRVIGIVLSGALDDGTAGLWAIKDRGGVALVQSPAEAAYSSMPQSALDHVRVDAALPVDEMAAVLTELAGESVDVEGGTPVSESMKLETQVALEKGGLETDILKLGPLSPNTCPECHGTMVQIQEGNIIRFRCHTGHAYSIQSLLAEVTETIDEHLWTTIRAVDERVFLLRQMAQLAKNDEEAAQCLVQARQAEERVEILRQLVLDKDDFGHDPAELPAQKQPTPSQESSGSS